MVRNIIIAVLVILLVALGIIAVYENQLALRSQRETQQALKDKDMAAMQVAEMKQSIALQQKMAELAKTMTIQLSEENKSGETGTAMLKEQNGKVTVTISLSGFTQDVAQPAHIHLGDCPGVGKVVYPLTDVVNGVSTTTLPVTLEQLKTQYPLALNVHKSKSQISLYTACGSLGSTGSVTPSLSPSPTQ